MDALLLKYVEQGGSEGIRLFQKICQGKLPGVEGTAAQFQSRDLCLNLIYDQKPPKFGAKKKLLWENLDKWANHLNDLEQGLSIAEPAHDDFLELSHLADPEAKVQLERLGKCRRNSFEEIRKSANEWHKVELFPGDKIVLPDSSKGFIQNLIRKGFAPLNKKKMPKEAETRASQIGYHYLNHETSREPPIILPSDFEKRFRTKIQTLDREEGPDGKLKPILLNALWSPTEKYLNPSEQPTVIAFHGNGEISETNSAAIRTYSRYGINVLNVTMRGYPGSDGDAVRDGEMGMILDGEAAVRFALEKLKIPANKLFLHGFSLGAATAVHAAKNFKLDVVVDRGFETAAGVSSRISRLPSCLLKRATESSYPSGVQFALPKGHFSGEKLLTTDGLNTLEKMKNLEKESFVISGSDDRVSPPEIGMGLLKARYPQGLNESISDYENRLAQNFHIVQPRDLRESPGRMGVSHLQALDPLVVEDFLTRRGYYDNDEIFWRVLWHRSAPGA